MHTDIKSLYQTYKKKGEQDIIVQMKWKIKLKEW